MEEKSKNKIQEKVEHYFDESINIGDYQSEQKKELLNRRKNKVFDLLFSKRKEGMESVVKGPNEIDINDLEFLNINKDDIDTYLKTDYNIKTWFKFIFSSNKKQVYEGLYLLRRYIELQVLELNENKRCLSRNDTELIQKLADYLLNDDIKIAYNSCACLTNLTFFPLHIEKRIYSEKNLEKYLKFFDKISKDISSYSYKSLLLFLNISTNEDVKINLIRNNFVESLYDFIQKILNNQIKFINDMFELETIKYCVRILYQLILICDLVDNNYMKYFLKFIPSLKIITLKYFVNVDNIAFNEDECKNIVSLWLSYIRHHNDENKNINEIIKDNFTQVLIKFYRKFKNIKNKIAFSEIFCFFSSFGELFSQIMINDGMVSLINEEIEKNQYSNVNLLKNFIFCCSNYSLGTIRENKELFNLGIIHRLMDITIFYIDDKLDKEIIVLLNNCLFCLINYINGIDRDMKKQLINYKECLIVKIFCKALKLDLAELAKNKISEKIIVIINELCVLSEELDEDKEKEFDAACINNLLIEILNNVYNKPHLDEVVKNVVEEIINFIKDKEKNI